ncbi:helix-turn-helix domain-containing protein [Johnsonella ignava]|uniref:helix-turn-helix domain-containing protein n=1 Tax=Johnsonella ignava TaxID=43995 RepID=UPI0012E9D8FF|nr:helix-turn-helix transcriptional regulator [Johnsonella ignava]
MKNLKLLREKANMSQSQLASIVHVSQQTICKYEHGESEAGYETLTKISNIFDVPIEFLVNDEISIDKYDSDNHPVILTDMEEECLKLFRHLEPSSKKLILELCRRLDPKENL